MAKLLPPDQARIGNFMWSTNSFLHSGQVKVITAGNYPHLSNWTAKNHQKTEIKEPDTYIYYSHSSEVHQARAWRSSIRIHGNWRTVRSKIHSHSDPAERKAPRLHPPANWSWKPWRQGNEARRPWLAHVLQMLRITWGYWLMSSYYLRDWQVDQRYHVCCPPVFLRLLDGDSHQLCLLDVNPCTWHPTWRGARKQPRPPPFGRWNW